MTVIARQLAVSFPSVTTSFVGRGDELAEVRRLLAESRLVTLSGVGGVGKSRLALQFAASVRRSFSHGVWIAELASLHDPSLLAESVMSTLGLANQSSAEPVTVLARYLSERHALLVMDNCEHLVGVCARLVTTLLSAAPRLRILATSREVLHLPGEHVLLVEPLSIPRSSELLDTSNYRSSSAMALFVERAAAAQHSFRVSGENLGDVADLCRRLDGLPLAIELAAARIRSLSVQQIAARLRSDDRFRLLSRGNTAAHPRHQTLRAAMDWSATLLTPAESMLWTRASVFVGAFDLDAAVAVCGGDGLAEGDVYEALAGLIDKSVLVSDDDDAGARQYWMLETVREYGLDRANRTEMYPIDAVDEPTLRSRHRDYYAAMADGFHLHWFGPDQLLWTHRMRLALPNVRQALGYYLATPGQEGAAVRLVGRLDFFWSSCGVNQEGARWLGRALAADPTPTADRARALAAYVRVLSSQSIHFEAAHAAQECLEIARGLDDPSLVNIALSGYGLNLLHRGEFAEATSMLDDAVAQARSLTEEPASLLVALMYRCFALTAERAMPRTCELLDDAQTVCRAHGETTWLAYVLAMSVPPLLSLGDTAKATVNARESLPLAAAARDNLGLTLSLELLAWCASAAGDHHRAARLYGAAAMQATMNGGSPFDVGPYHEAREPYEAATRSSLGAAAFEAEKHVGAELALNDAVAYALTGESRPATAAVVSFGERILTRRERQVADLICEGLSNKEIAAKLFITHRTVEGHIENVFVKLGLNSRVQLAAWQNQHGPHATT